MTPQRMAILNYLKDNKDHPAVEDIYKSIITQFPTISLATVYKNLEMLKNLGMLKELSIGQDKKHFDPNVSPHHHLICKECKKIVDIDVKFDLNIPEHSKKGFEIIGSHIEFYGICPECKKKS
ncbi:MAG: transcriptional repressor [Thermodesulfovibrionales bacterium]|nr:transcriptional repressor [Thermodesulfovibrionales bacterium]